MTRKRDLSAGTAVSYVLEDDTLASLTERVAAMIDPDDDIMLPLKLAYLSNKTASFFTSDSTIWQQLESWYSLEPQWIGDVKCRIGVQILGNNSGFTPLKGFKKSSGIKIR